MATNQTSHVLCLGCNQFFTDINMHWSHNVICSSVHQQQATVCHEQQHLQQQQQSQVTSASTTLCQKMMILLKQAHLFPKKATIRTLMEMALSDHILGSLVVTPPPISLAVPLVELPTVNLPLHYWKQEACSISKPDLMVAIVLFQ
jgi:hypothetical protein